MYETLNIDKKIKLITQFSPPHTSTQRKSIRLAKRAELNHFERPIEKSKMEAIQILIEQGKKKPRKSATSKRMATQVGLAA
jgi:hypothetical protein